MSIGYGGFMENLLTYPVLIMSIIIVVVSAIVLLVKGKQLNKNMKRIVVILLIIASAVLLFLVIVAISFGNAHQPSSPLPIEDNETESFSSTESESSEIEESILKDRVYNRIYEYMKEESIAAFSPYYELLDFQISNYEEQIIDGDMEATFFYKIINKNYDKDPDTVGYIKEAKESGSINYQQMYNEYLEPKEMNFEFKIIIDKNDSITLFSNISPNGVEWDETNMTDYIIK